MDVDVVIERVRRVDTARSVPGNTSGSIEAILGDVRSIRSWLDAAEGVLVSSLREQSSFPEASIASASRGTLGAAAKTIDRAQTLQAAPGFADALHDGVVTSAHVDELTRAGATLETAQRTALFARCESLVDVAERATVEEWRRRVRAEARRIAADDDMTRLDRQRRAACLRSWVDEEGMWNLRGRFDPLTGVRIAARLDSAVETLLAEVAPSTCPTDPIDKQHHLRALALDRLVCNPSGGLGAPRPGRAEFVVVIDATAPADVDDAGPAVSWPIPVEVPWRVLAELAGDADVHAVVVRNGIVLHAPGQLDLGRTTRLASRAQRRALRGLYTTCAIPGCTTHYDRCKLHHVIWWRHGGRTDLDNLLPLCSHHHTRVHDHGWQLALGPNRELQVSFPDGTIRSTGPPKRRAA